MNDLVIIKTADLIDAAFWATARTQCLSKIGRVNILGVVNKRIHNIYKYLIIAAKN